MTSSFSLVSVSRPLTATQCATFHGLLTTFFFYQLNATSIPESDHETPVKDNTESAEQSQYLTTINYDTLSGLREDDQTTEVQSAAKQGSASQEVGEELISTCVTLTRIKTIQRVLSKPETERHLCTLKLLPHFFSKEELAESSVKLQCQIKFAENVSLQ